MQLGSKVLLKGRRFGFNLVKGVRHSHNYSDLNKYFARVFIDVLAISSICKVDRKKRLPRPRILDTIVSAYALVHDIFADWIERNHSVLIAAGQVKEWPTMGVVHQVGRVHTQTQPALFQTLGLASSIDLGLVNHKIIVQKAERAIAIIMDIVEFFSPPFQQHAALDAEPAVKTLFKAALVNAIADDLARAVGKYTDDTSLCAQHLSEIQWR
jgi:hypothetical protein